MWLITQHTTISIVDIGIFDNGRLAVALCLLFLWGHFKTWSSKSFEHSQQIVRVVSYKITVRSNAHSTVSALRTTSLMTNKNTIQSWQFLLTDIRPTIVSLTHINYWELSGCFLSNLHQYNLRVMCTLTYNPTSKTASL